MKNKVPSPARKNGGRPPTSTFQKKVRFLTPMQEKKTKASHKIKKRKKETATLSHKKVKITHSHTNN